MVLKKLLYSVVGCMLFTSCYDEDALTPGDRVLESRFEFPQGSNSWDEEAQDILDEFGIYLIYKNYAEDDFNLLGQEVREVEDSNRIIRDRI